MPLSVTRNSILSFSLLVSASIFAEEPLTPLEADQKAVEETILSGDLTNGLVLASSALYVHQNHPEFFELTQSIRRAYSSIEEEEAKSLLDFRVNNVGDNPSGLAWLDVGLLAQAHGKSDIARQAFQSALTDPDCCRIPSSYVLLGKASLDIGDETAALVAYASAVNSASLDLDNGFRIRHACANDLFDRGRYQLAHDALQRCHEESNLPLERACALTMQIIYADWYDRNEAEAAINLAELEQFYASEVTAPTLEWQKRVYSYMNKLRGVAHEAIEGSTEARMIMDSFAALASFRQWDREAVAERMEPWAESYTLDDIAALEDPERAMALDALASYYMAIRTRENAEEIVAFFQSVLDHPVLGAIPKNVVDSNCNMGYAMSNADRLEEALAYYEVGLTVDEQNAEPPPDPSNPHPPYIRGGVVGPDDRAAYVANYRNVRDRLEASEGE